VRGCSAERGSAIPVLRIFLRRAHNERMNEDSLQANVEHLTKTKDATTAPLGLSTGHLAVTFLFKPCIIQIAVLGGRTDEPWSNEPRSNEQWIAQYAGSHQHPVNRMCHTLGIPAIVVSIALFVTSIFVHRVWLYALALFLLGWTLQVIGHAFERKEPEFFHDWRFLFVGVRWWWAKIHGKA